MEGLAAEAPAADEFELSVFGTGHGEALALHVGQGQWGLVDSCRDPVTNDPVGLAYLVEMGVDPQQIKFIVATHWHDDHIDGLAETLRRCTGALFACSAAYTGDEFRAVTLEARGIEASGVDEMRACFEVLEGRPRYKGARQAAKRVIEDQTTWWRDDDLVTVYAVAPTSLAIDRAAQDIADKLLPDVRRRRALGKITPNQASIAAIVKFPADNVLLGGDVEERNAGGSGWTAIIARQASHAPKSSVFKVPHHGSENAHHDRQWSDLLSPGPLSVVTTFSKSGRPRNHDVRRIAERSRETYLCARGSQAWPKLAPSARRAIQQDGVTLSKPSELGHARLRRSLTDSDAPWSVQLSSAAVLVSEELLSTTTPTVRNPRRGRRRR